MGNRKINYFCFCWFSAQNQIGQKKSYIFKPVEFLSTMIHWSLVCHVWPGREADVIPIRPLFPWTCIFIHHFCHMLSTHSHLDQTQGPTASVNSKEVGRLLYKIAQTTATLESRNNSEQLQQLLIIYYSQARDQWVNQLAPGWTRILYLSYKRCAFR